MTVRLVVAVALFCLISSACVAYDPNWTRNQADTYSFHGLNERYVFGGDKWIDNNTWDSSSVEGCDCSGYTAKSFAIPQWYAENVSAGHPYNTDSYYNDTCPYTILVDRTVGGFMTAWVYLYSGGGHTGLFVYKNSDGTWACREAKGSSYGIVTSNRSISTLISSNNYHRYDRNNWGTPATEIIIDNTDARFSCSANWATGTSSTDKYGTNYRWRSTEAVSDMAVWTPNVSGTYDIYAWWPQGTNRYTATPYRITHTGGTTVVNCNQQTNGGKWNLLGTFSLNTSSNIAISCWCPTGYIVVADAIRLVSH